ncbi:MAG TPA: diguanylate cyclase [Candidatus Limnocylindrales bacterium]
MDVRATGALARRPVLGPYLRRLPAASTSDIARGLVRASVLVLAYLAAAQVGFAFALVDGNASPIWPPAGIAAAALYLWGPQVAPAVVLAALVTNLVNGVPAGPAAVIAVGNGLEALAAAGLLRSLRVRPQLDRLVDVPLLLVAATAAAVVGTGIGIVGLLFGHVVQVAHAPVAVAAWFTGDALSILIVGGLSICWASPSENQILRQRPLEAFAILGSVIVAASVLFFDVFDLRASGQAVAFPLIPVVVWVAFRVGPRGTALAAALYSTIAILATDRGLGPFVGATREGSLLYVAGFIALAAVTGAAVAAIVAERDRADTGLRDAMESARQDLVRLEAVGAFGRMLSTDGPTPATLTTLVDVLADAFGYEAVALYLGDADLVRLAAQRGPASGAPEIRPGDGWVGQVLTTAAPAYLPSGEGGIVAGGEEPAAGSQACVPLRTADGLIGVLHVASSRGLDPSDLATLRVIADRAAAGLAVARERERLATRAATFRRLVTYSERITGVLRQDDLFTTCVEALDAVVPADLVGLTVLDPHSGAYVVRAEKGSAGSIGATIRPGEGPAGQAIRDQRLVHLAPYSRDAFPSGVADRNAADGYAEAVGVPLLRDGAVLGALTVARVDPQAPFTDLELEALSLLADETTLAIANALLHAEVAELAIHDGLTGLHNRRYFDDAIQQVLEAHKRAPIAARPPLSAILFDLDHFGDLNARHGHQVGDEVLRVFGRLLRDRLRGADLVARYGGEEFVVVLPGASRDDAVRIADQVRRELADVGIRGVDGGRLTVTVSAGCAVFDEREGTAETLIAAADIGLLMAKRSGRDAVVAA